MPESSFGLGGRLVRDNEDDSLFWVDIEGKQFMFQLSLCGPLTAENVDVDDGIRLARNETGGETIDEVGDAARFEDGKVTFERFSAEPDLLEREDLVIRWGVT